MEESCVETGLRWLNRNCLWIGDPQRSHILRVGAHALEQLEDHIDQVDLALFNSLSVLTPEQLDARFYMSSGIIADEAAMRQLLLAAHASTTPRLAISETLKYLKDKKIPLVCRTTGLAWLDRECRKNIDTNEARRLHWAVISLEEILSDPNFELNAFVAASHWTIDEIESAMTYPWIEPWELYSLRLLNAAGRFPGAIRETIAFLHSRLANVAVF